MGGRSGSASPRVYGRAAAPSALLMLKKVSIASCVGRTLSGGRHRGPWPQRGRDGDETEEEGEGQRGGRDQRRVGMERSRQPVCIKREG
ncbi:hypothetical protein ABZP36_031100 [Zizania latifolia]